MIGSQLTRRVKYSYDVKFINVGNGPHRLFSDVVAYDYEQLTELIEFVGEVEEIINSSYSGFSSESNFQVE